MNTTKLKSIFRFENICMVIAFVLIMALVVFIDSHTQERIKVIHHTRVGTFVTEYAVCPLCTNDTIQKPITIK